MSKACSREFDQAEITVKKNERAKVLLQCYFSDTQKQQKKKEEKVKEQMKIRSRSALASFGEREEKKEERKARA